MKTFNGFLTCGQINFDSSVQLQNEQRYIPTHSRELAAAQEVSRLMVVFKSLFIVCISLYGDLFACSA